MNTAQQRAESEKPMGIDEMLIDIRKRLGRIERDLIALFPPKPKTDKAPDRR